MLEIQNRFGGGSHIHTVVFHFTLWFQVWLHLGKTLNCLAKCPCCACTICLWLFQLLRRIQEFQIVELEWGWTAHCWFWIASEISSRSPESLKRCKNTIPRLLSQSGIWNFRVSVGCCNSCLPHDSQGKYGRDGPLNGDFQVIRISKTHVAANNEQWRNGPRFLTHFPMLGSLHLDLDLHIIMILVEEPYFKRRQWVLFLTYKQMLQLEISPTGCRADKFQNRFGL